MVKTMFSSSDNNIQEKQRLFVDMDGTLARFEPLSTLEDLYEPGYFYNLEPQQNVIDAVVSIIKNNPEIEVYALSAVLSDSQYAENEKNAWLDEHIPQIDANHRIFCPCGVDKGDYVEGGLRPDDILLDDYTTNLMAWEPPARGIKLMNGINHTKGTWQGPRVSMKRESDELADKIVSIMKKAEHVLDDFHHDAPTGPFYGVSEYNHSAEHVWLFNEETLKRELPADRIADIKSEINRDGHFCEEILWPIGGSNASATFVERFDTLNDAKSFLTDRCDGPDLEDPTLVDLAEYYRAVETDMGITKEVLDKYGLDAKDLTKADPRVDELISLGYEVKDMYGDKRDMRYSEAVENSPANPSQSAIERR